MKKRPKVIRKWPIHWPPAGALQTFQLSFQHVPGKLIENTGNRCHRAICIGTRKKVWIFTQLGSHKTLLPPITSGVPKGSIVDPVLFLLRIDDKFLSSMYLSFILFADDTNKFFKHRDISELCDTVNREISLVASCLN